MIPLCAAKTRKMSKTLRILDQDSGTFQKGWDMNGDIKNKTQTIFANHWFHVQ